MVEYIAHTPRQPREENPAYLAWVRTQPCIICARPGPNDPAHLRSASRQYDKPLTGGGRKPSDRWVLPLCRTHHEDQHRENELRWWARMGFPDPFALAVALYASCPVPHRPTVHRLFNDRPVKARKPREQRATIHNRTEWPKGRKIPTRKKETAS